MTKKKTTNLAIKLNNRTTFFFVPGDPEYNIDPKMHTKSQSGAYQKKKIKTRVPKLAKTEREVSKFIYTRYS